MWFTILKRHFHGGTINHGEWLKWINGCLELLTEHEDSHPNASQAMAACAMGYKKGHDTPNKRPAIIINVSKFFPNDVFLNNPTNQSKLSSPKWTKSLQWKYLNMCKEVFGLKAGELSVKREKPSTLPKSIWRKD